MLGDSDAGGDLESRGRDVIFGQDRIGHGKERRPIDFAIDMFGTGRKVSESTIVPLSWMTGRPWQTGVRTKIYTTSEGNQRISQVVWRSLWMNTLEDPPRGLYHIALVDQSVTSPRC